MEIQYDENLAANPFLKKIRTHHVNLIDLASIQKLIICIPRIGSIDPKQQLDEDTIMSHVLVPNEELPETHFACANNNGNIVTLTKPKKLLFQTVVGGQIEANVLFEEIFYTKDFMKYKIWCIDRPFIGCGINQIGNGNHLGSCNDLFYVHNLKDAIELIWTEVQSKHILRKIDTSLSNFRKNNREFRNTDLEKLKNNTLLLYNHCVDMLLLNRKLKEKCKSDSFFLKNLRIAVETYMINALYTHLFDAITLCTIDENEKFNKIIGNLADVQLSEFNIDPKLYEFVPAMKLELIKIDNHTTVLDKLSCIKRALNTISDRYNKKMNNNKILTTDDVIPVLIFVIIKSGCRHWITHLHFIKEFSFTDYSSSGNEFGAENFLVATLEAAITFIMNNDIKGRDLISDTDGIFKEKFTNKDDYLEYLFAKIKQNDDEEVQRLLEPFNQISGALDNGINNPFFDLPTLCHPLCDCSDCKKKILESTPSINSRNKQGFTPIFVPVIYGSAKMLNLLLTFSADVNVSDENGWTPLHHAASRGHQNSLLLLLHAGADINSTNLEMNSPLHLACLYGFVNCAKALLYFSEHMKIKLAINAQNKHGDTALHIASKWGFLELVSALLENGARLDVTNKFGHTAVQMAHSTKVTHVMQDTYVVVSTVSQDFDAPHGVQNICLTDEDLMDDLNHLCVVSKVEKMEELTAYIEQGNTKAAIGLLNIQPIEGKSSCHPLCSCTNCLQQKFKATISPIPIDSLDINEKNSDGNTALHLAGAAGNYNLTKILLDNGADITLVNKHQQTCLHTASQYSRYQIVKLILRSSAGDILDVKDNHGETALMYGAKLGDGKLVESLLSFEPQLNIKNENGMIALDIAKEKMYLGIVKLLERALKIVDEKEEHLSDSN